MICIARTICCRKMSARLSVCPFVCHTPIFCRNGHQTFFHNPVATHPSFFLHQFYLPSIMEAKYETVPSIRIYQFQWPWVIPNVDFKVTILFNVKWLQNGTRQDLQRPTNRNSYMIYRAVPFSMTLHDPKLRFQGVYYYYYFYGHYC